MADELLNGPSVFTGWGRTAASLCIGREIRTVDNACQTLRDLLATHQSGRGAIPRGLGRSYGDQAQNSGGEVWLSANCLLGESELTSINIDEDLGTITCGAGVSFDELIRYLVPRGWFVPVTPGTRYVTVGGAIANDIHGKNHHQGGSFGEYVDQISLLLSSGEVIDCSRSESPAVFLATIGGGGLTGLICKATFRLKKIESSMMNVQSERAQNLEQLMEKLIASESEYEYTVAWIDLLSTGKDLGRGVVLAGNHADSNDGPQSRTSNYVANARLVAPPAPSGMLNKMTIKAFNELWYRKAPSRKSQTIESIPKFFHPLDGIRSWNRLYGTRGFVQYQFVVPESESSVIHEVVSKFADAGIASFLAVLKRFGPGSEAFLSFPQPGWTLALDIPANVKLQGFLDGLDRRVVSTGGRHYVAKDSHMRRAIFEAGYPMLPRWKEVKAQVDPHGVWSSDAGRRLGLC